MKTLRQYHAKRFGIEGMIRLTMGLLILGMFVTMAIVFTSQAATTINNANATVLLNQLQTAFGIFGQWFGLIILIAIMALILGLLVGVYAMYTRGSQVLE